MKYKRLFIIFLSVLIMGLSDLANALGSRCRSKNSTGRIHLYGRSQPCWLNGASINAGNYLGDFSVHPSNEQDDLFRNFKNLSFSNDIKEFQIGLEDYLFPKNLGSS